MNSRHVLISAALLVAGAVAYRGIPNELVLTAGVLALAVMALVVFMEDGDLWALAFLIPVTVFTDFSVKDFTGVFLASPPRIGYLLALGPALMLRSYVRHERLWMPREAWAVPAFFGVLMLTLPFSGDLKKSIIYFLQNYGLGLIVFLYALRSFHNEKGRRILVATLFFVLAANLLFIYFQSLTQSLGFGAQWRSMETVEELTTFALLRSPGFFGTTYVTSEFCVLLIPFMLIGFRVGEGWKKWFAGGLILAMFVAILLTQQRSGVLIAGVEILIFTMIERKQHIGRRIIKSALIAGAGILVLFWLFQDNAFVTSLFERMRASFTADSITDVNDAGSTLVRLQRAVIGWLIFLDHKLVGIGMGLAPDVYPTYGWNWTQFDGGAHNAYLQRLCETGLVGLTGYVVFLVHYFRSVIRRLRSSAGSDRHVWAGFVVFGIAIVMDGLFSELLSGIGLLFLMLALAYVFSHFGDHEALPCRGDA